MTCLVATMLEPRLDLRNPDALNGPQWPDKFLFRDVPVKFHLCEA